MNDLLFPLLISSGAASYIAAFFNQPKFPSWLKLLVVFVVCLVAAYLQQAQGGSEGIDLKVRVAMTFSGALLLYNNLLKSLGGDWLTHFTVERGQSMVKTLASMFMRPPGETVATAEVPSEIKAAQVLREKLTALDTLKDLLTTEEYKDRRSAIIHGGSPQEGV